tara:strand:+ start:1710 stop:3497 length:1788 start_codon:yes stop_codon:yes gene_type:complete
MEVAILSGLVGLGYLFNESNKDNDPVNTSVENDAATPNGDNIYNSEFYNEADKVIRTLAKDNFESSHEEGSNVINTQKLDRIGSDLYNPPLSDTSNELDELKENFENYIYSNASGSYISNDNFSKNDQGIGMAPYFSGSAPTNEGLENSRTLNAHQGGNDAEFHRSKRETSNFFPLEKQQVFGNTFGEGMGDPGRYDSGILKTSQLPFTQERVSHIDTKSDMNQEIARMIAEKTNIDNLRAESNPKLTHKGKILSGKNLTESRGKQGKMFQYNPDTYYENTADKWLVTTGAQIEKTQRPAQIIPETNRSVINHQPIGSAAPVNFEGQEKRASVRKPMKNQLGTDTVRNTGTGVSAVATEMHQKGYKAPPNERDITTLRNHQSNLKGGYDARTMDIQDNIKKTVKETTLTPKNNGFMNNVTLNTTMGIQDNVKKTKKQTTIESKNNGYITGGYEKSTSPYEVPDTTMKDTTMFDYMGVAGGVLKGEMEKQNYMNADTNPTREIELEGREPTPNNVKIANGMDTVNMEINKLDYDYMNHRLNSVERVYQTPQNDSNGEITTMKDRLEDNKIATRIDPSLLNPFRDNPLTQSLESFAY